jgi:MFS family permease
MPPETSSAPPVPYPGARIALLGVLAVMTLVPVTLPVTVLRGLVQERFGVGEFLASVFMSINMVGAVIAAPIAGALADRRGRRSDLIVAALVLDALLLGALALPVPFEIFMGIRFLEGGAHIVALSLLLSLASQARPEAQRGRVMGLVGGGIMLGVAIGAPLGGVLGREDPIRPLYAASALVALAAGLAWRTLDETPIAATRPSLRQVVAALRAHPLVLAPLAFAFADRFTVGFYTTTFSFFLSRIHALPPPRIGLLMAAFMLPFALLSYPFGRLSERTSRVAMICGGSLVYGLFTAGVPWCPAPALPLLMLGLGVASAVMFVPSLLLTSEAAPESIRTTAMGAFNAAGSLGFIVGPAVGGLLSELVAERSDWLTGYRTAFGVAGASEIACVALGLPFLIALVRRARSG